MANGGGSSAVDSLEQLFVKANNDLTVVQHKLETEFEQKYPSNVNPLKLMSRIKKIQEELPSLKEQCQKLLEAKQDLIDKTQSTLVGNRALLQRMQTRANIPIISDSDDTVYTSLEKIIEEWNEQLGLKSTKKLGSDLSSGAVLDLLLVCDSVYAMYKSHCDVGCEDSNDTGHDNGSVALEDLNQKLFSSKIQNS